MLRKIKSTEKHLIVNDPVRPHIEFEWRVSNGREIYILEDDNTQEIKAVICVAYTDEIPTNEDDMNNVGDKVAVFYTVWSHAKGAGRDIVFAVANHIKENKPKVVYYVTLSPLTDMARNFHIKNGAKFLNRHLDCQNFEYYV